MTTHYCAYLACVFTFIGSLLAPQKIVDIPVVKVNQIEKSFTSLTDEQHLWIGALAWCESGGKDTAINPLDLDGTPSFGLFQFKPATFKIYSARYGIATTSLMNGREQRAIVERMISDPTVVWQQQFPDCVHKLGLPPRQ